MAISREGEFSFHHNDNKYNGAQATAADKPFRTFLSYEDWGCPSVRQLARGTTPSQDYHLKKGFNKLIKYFPLFSFNCFYEKFDISIGTALLSILKTVGYVISIKNRTQFSCLYQIHDMKSQFSFFQ